MGGVSGWRGWGRAGGWCFQEQIGEKWSKDPALVLDTSPSPLTRSTFSLGSTEQPQAAPVCSALLHLLKWLRTEEAHLICCCVVQHKGKPTAARSRVREKATAALSGIRGKHTAALSGITGKLTATLSRGREKCTAVIWGKGKCTAASCRIRGKCTAMLFEVRENLLLCYPG